MAEGETALGMNDAPRPLDEIATNRPQFVEDPQE